MDGELPFLLVSQSFKSYSFTLCPTPVSQMWFSAVNKLKKYEINSIKYSRKRYRVVHLVFFIAFQWINVVVSRLEFLHGADTCMLRFDGWFNRPPYLFIKSF